MNTHRPVTVVVLAKYKEIFRDFVSTITKYEPKVSKILVQDGEEVSKLVTVLDVKDSNPPKNWKVIQGPAVFSMAGNGNLGLKAVNKDHDILYCGDDVRFIEENTIQRLQEVAYSDPTIGIVSPRIIGRGSPTQVSPQGDIAECVPLEFWFPCVYIKRELINKIGFLDEDFNKFGSDDLDYVLRAKIEGYKVVVASNVAVQHEAGPGGGPTTFERTIGFGEGFQKEQAASYQKLAKKYNVDLYTMHRIITTGNVSSLKPKSDVKRPSFSHSPTEQQKQQMKEYLRTRSVYIATPAYGGMMAVNYVNSLTSFMAICIDWGIKYQTAFLYNESLITRARNTLVNKYLNESEATDFFFIDADIGFDPNDLIALLTYDEEIVCAPCVRKNLRLDRIQKAVRMQPEKDFSVADMRALLGEYVLNFPPDSAPKEIDLASMLEVQHGGTGLMRIKREVFTKFSSFHTEGRWHLPMRGEQEDKPIYMYFQAMIDPESGKYNPRGLPHYISEDYAFCIDARKAGMKVYIAPWMKTTHLGSYLFEGDMRSVALAGGSLR